MQWAPLPRQQQHVLRFEVSHTCGRRDPSLPENRDLWVVHVIRDDLRVKICRHLGLEAAQFVTFSAILLITVPKCQYLLSEVVILLISVILKTGAEEHGAVSSTCHQVQQ